MLFKNPLPPYAARLSQRVKLRCVCLTSQAWMLCFSSAVVALKSMKSHLMVIFNHQDYTKSLVLAKGPFSPCYPDHNQRQFGRRTPCCLAVHSLPPTSLKTISYHDLEHFSYPSALWMSVINKRNYRRSVISKQNPAKQLFFDIKTINAQIADDTFRASSEVSEEANPRIW